MIMAVSDSLFGIHATALKLREQRMALLASNIANSATPNYKARDLDFRAALDAAEAGGATEEAIRYRVPVQSISTVLPSSEDWAGTRYAIAALVSPPALAALRARR